MRVLFDNVSWSSPSGPNRFASRLARQLALTGHSLADPVQGTVDAQLSFICMTTKLAPVALRLDGIYFNSEQDYATLNAPIRMAHDIADAVIVQSEFDRELIERYFGRRDDVTVIRNGTDTGAIDDAQPLFSPQLDSFSEVWCCASSWRPHKRLAENVRCFMEMAPSDACFVIAGGDPDVRVADPRVFYAGHLSEADMLSLFKRATTFIHLARLDHCPNVVVDAHAAGCRIICASSGGTSEIAGSDAIVIEDEPWDWKPCRLYNPPMLDFSRLSNRQCFDAPNDIASVALEYIDVLQSMVDRCR